MFHFHILIFLFRFLFIFLSDIARWQRASSLRLLPRKVVGIAAVVHQREREVLLGSGGGQTLAPPDTATGHVLAL